MNDIAILSQFDIPFGEIKRETGNQQASLIQAVY